MKDESAAPGGTAAGTFRRPHRRALTVRSGTARFTRRPARLAVVVPAASRRRGGPAHAQVSDAGAFPLRRLSKAGA